MVTNLVTFSVENNRTGESIKANHLKQTLNLMKMERLFRNKCPVVRKATVWLFKIATVSIFTFLLIWYLLYLLRASQDLHAISKMESDNADNFCIDKHGYYISRRDVQITKQMEIKKKYFMTIGVPTIERIQNGKRFTYLVKTLKDLIKKIPQRARENILIIIFCADEDAESRRRISESVSRNFHELIESGLIRIIQAPKRFYYNLENLPRTFNDTQVRMKWRGKQSLDYAYMFYYSYGLAEYHLQLEDDITCDDDFFEKIEGDILNTKPKWIILRYYRMGFIGILMKSEFLKMFADILRMYYFEMPLDWMYIAPFQIAGLRGIEKIGSRFVFHHKGEFSSSRNFED